jgi:hypothetical protein
MRLGDWWGEPAGLSRRGKPGGSPTSRNAL